MLSHAVDVDVDVDVNEFSHRLICKKSLSGVQGALAPLHRLGRLAVPVHVRVPDPEMTNDECLMTKEARRTKP